MTNISPGKVNNQPQLFIQNTKRVKKKKESKIKRLVAFVALPCKTRSDSGRAGKAGRYPPSRKLNLVATWKVETTPGRRERDLSPHLPLSLDIPFSERPHMTFAPCVPRFPTYTIQVNLKVQSTLQGHTLYDAPSARPSRPQPASRSDSVSPKPP